MREVQEYFADFMPVNTDFYSLNIQPPRQRIYSDSPNTWDSSALDRSVEGILALLLAMKKRPIIRYERMSSMAKKLGNEVQYRIQQDNALFDFRRTETPPLLLIVDRRNDPVTPLLSQWTYQAMVHEMLGIQNGRVSLGHVKEIKPELREIVLSADQDPFYSRNMYLNFGDLGENIKTYVTEYQSKTKSSMNIESIADMKRFVEEYPEFRKLSGNVSKHVALVGELSRLVDQENLLEVSELEQSFATNENHNSDLRNLQRLLEMPTISDDSKLRLVLLYALRYEKREGNAIPQLIDLLARAGISDSRLSLVASILAYAGAEQRQDDLFANESFFARRKNVFKGLKGVENVYTQHSPHLATILDLLFKGKLRDTSYPFVEASVSETASATAGPSVKERRPRDVIVFMIGGATYEEARFVAQVNSSGSKAPQANATTAGAAVAASASTAGVGGAKIILGATGIHNSKSFLEELRDGGSRWHDFGSRINPSYTAKAVSGLSAATKQWIGRDDAANGAALQRPLPAIPQQQRDPNNALAEIGTGLSVAAGGIANVAGGVVGRLSDRFGKARGNLQLT